MEGPGRWPGPLDFEDHIWFAVRGLLGRSSIVAPDTRPSPVEGAATCFCWSSLTTWRGTPARRSFWARFIWMPEPAQMTPATGLNMSGRSFWTKADYTPRHQ